LAVWRFKNFGLGLAVGHRSEQYRNILLVMEMVLERPEIRFEEISRATGVETIEEVRLGTADA
jgi:hypothetical protein